MIDQIQAWRRLAGELGIEVAAPCDIQLKDGSHVRATAHVKAFGADNGMIIDTDFGVLRPHTDALLADGYGYSCVELTEACDIAAMIDMLADWGWTSRLPRPAWLPVARS